MTGVYDLQLVALSVIVAIMASYTALELAGRVSQKQGASSWAWLVGGAVSMGIGIWSMHFIGMLAFKLPVAVAYDAAATMLSMAIAIVVSGLALFVVRRPALTAKNLAAGATLMGLGISAMHYTGMQAMRMSPPIEYHPPLLIASIIIAIVASLAALWIAFRLRRKHSGVALLAKLGSATIMGLAITGMHYTGMAAAQFAPDTVCLAVDSTGGMKSGVLALTVGIATICILVLTQAAISLENALLYTDLRQENNDRKRAEEVLREQASLLDLTHDTVFVRDMNSVITYWNRGAEERYGWTRQEAVGQVAQQLLQTIFPQPLEKIDAELLRVDRWEGELIHSRRDGTPVVLASRWALRRDEAGKPVAILETNNDITERNRWRSLTEALPQLVWAATPDGACDYFSTQWTEYTGVPEAGLLGWRWMGVLHPDDRENTRKIWADSVAGRRPYDVEYRVRRHDAAYGWFKTRGTPIRDSEGRIIKWFGTCTDITDRRRAEEALYHSEQALRRARDELELKVAERTAELQRSEAYLAEAQKLSRTGSFGWRVSSGEIFWSEETYRIFEFDRAAKPNIENTLQATHPADFAMVEQIVARASQDGKDFAHEYRLLMPDGRAKHVDVVARASRDAAGSLEFVGAVMDITERKQGQAEREARRAADLANQAKSEFLARMSHELRTPLTGILGYAEILRGDRTLTDRQSHGVSVIRQSGEHLLTLINDILDFARIEAGKLELSVTEIPTAGFLHIIADIIRVRAEEKQLAFSCDFAPDLPPGVLADERRLRQVLLNLLANAVKFTDRGEVSLRVSFSPPARLRFEVRDTGIGISEDRWETIFRPFEQAGDMQHRVGGTGLGLAISRQLVRLMGSDIEIESKLGEGSNFRFELDLPVVQARAAAASSETVITGYTGPRRKVLVVDDVAANRMLLGDMLAPLGFELAEAANGREGVETAGRLRPDLILMDTLMPETDGLEATRLLRQLSGLGEVAIIAISANASGSNEATALAAGADAFLRKPIDLSSLLAQIGHLLQLQWTRELRESSPPPRHGAPEPLVAPPAQQLAVLHHLALLGNMRDIAQHAAQLSELDGRYGAFAEELKLLAKGYQSKAILRLVEQHLNAEHLPTADAVASSTRGGATAA